MSAKPLTDPLYRRTVWRLLLPIAVLTFINAIDRMNVSFAGQQMSQRCGLDADAFGLGVSTFFIAYLLFQYPHALLLRRSGIRVWLLLSMTVWGIAGLMMSRVQDAGGFPGGAVRARRCRGGIRARHDLVHQPVDTARHPRPRHGHRAVGRAVFAGGRRAAVRLAAGHVQPAGLDAWRWMFLVAAVPNFVFALVAAAYFVDRPAQARWLDPGEGERLEERIAAEARHSAAAAVSAATSPQAARCPHLAVRRGLVPGDDRLLRAGLLAAADRPAAGHCRSELLIGTLSALPQAGLVTGLFLNARHSDRKGERLWHTAAGAVLAGMALIIAVLLPVGPGVLAMLVIAGFGIGASRACSGRCPQRWASAAGRCPSASSLLSAWPAQPAASWGHP